MEAKEILKLLVRESINMEFVGILTMPDECLQEFMIVMFGEGAVDKYGSILPGRTYLYAYGDVLDVMYESVITNDAGELITLTRVDQ